MRITVLVPSRGRPDRAGEMYRSAMETAADGGDGTRVLFLVDEDDPTADQYNTRGLPLRIMPPGLFYTGVLNVAARDLWDEVDVLGAFGDDVIFRTAGWDDRVRETLRTPGMAYGDDLIHGEAHPSAVFMSSRIAMALGWLALPYTTHQWADDAWKVMGQTLGILRFMPKVVVEHMHPAVEKAAWDATYQAVFDGDRAKADYEGFVAWRDDGGMESDLAKARRVIG